MKRHLKALLFIGTTMVGGLSYAAEPSVGSPSGTADHEALASRYEQEGNIAQRKADGYRQQLTRYQRRGNGNYATVKGGFINHLRFLERKYQKAADEGVALATRQQSAMAQQ